MTSTAPNPALPEVDWDAAKAAVAASARRLTALLRGVAHPSAPALGEWNLTDVAVHISHTVDGITGLVRHSGSLVQDVWELSTLTGVMLAGETERDLGVIADRIEVSVGTFLEEMDASQENSSRSWLVQGVRLSLSTLTCHVLNELTVHSFDIAKADGVPWSIDRAYAALVLRGFLSPALNSLGRSIVNQETAQGIRACVEVRARDGGPPVYYRFNDGDLRVTASPDGKIDCHLSVDPAAFLLVAWGRMNQWKGISRGQLLAWGRKPWLGLRLRGMLRNP